MDSRETKEITTPAGTVIVIHTYITGRERRALQFAWLKQASDYKPEDLAAKGINGIKLEESQDLGFKFVIVSVNGKKDGDPTESGAFSVLDWVLSLPSKEYDFVLRAINDVTRDRDFEEEKKTS